MTIRLPVTWSVCGMIEVEADSILGAIEYFNEHSDHIRLPREYEYVEGSFELSFCEELCILLYQTKRIKFQLLTQCMTFIEACAQNLCTATEIDDFVEYWNAEGVPGKELREAVGMDAEQYSRWLLEGEDYLQQIIKEGSGSGTV